MKISYDLEGNNLIYGLPANRAFPVTLEYEFGT